jgi:hypothetical protein
MKNSGSGVPAQNAIGVWNSGALSNKEVFLVNLGEDSNGVDLGFRKMQMGDCGNSYTVTFCDMGWEQRSHGISADERTIGIRSTCLSAIGGYMILNPIISTGT